jgi:hypothetical protein
LFLPNLLEKKYFFIKAVEYVYAKVKYRKTIGENLLNFNQKPDLLTHVQKRMEKLVVTTSEKVRCLPYLNISTHAETLVDGT